MKVLKLQFKGEDGWQSQKERLLKEQEKISLITYRGKEQMEADIERGRSGFCHRRFKANILMDTSDSVNVETMKTGDQILGTEAILTIEKVGKKCHRDCPIYRKAGCSFLKEIIFLEVEKCGRIRLMEKLEYKENERENINTE